jgi:homocysteine S-methyltransferase
VRAVVLDARLRHRASRPGARPVGRPLVGAAPARRPPRPWRPPSSPSCGRGRGDRDGELPGERRVVRGRGPRRGRGRRLLAGSVATARRARARSWSNDRTRRTRWWRPRSVPTAPSSRAARSTRAPTAQGRVPELERFHERRCGRCFAAGPDVGVRDDPAGRRGRGPRPPAGPPGRLRRLGRLHLSRRADDGGRRLHRGRPWPPPRRAGGSCRGRHCTAPEHVGELLERCAAVTGRALVAYPNSGRSEDGAGRAGGCRSARVACPQSCVRALDRRGASVVGGCCGLGPDDDRRTCGGRRLGSASGTRMARRTHTISTS